MRRSVLAVWLAVACDPQGVGLPAPDAPPVEVRVFLDGPARSGGGNLIVQTEFDVGGEVQIPEPVATGLEFVVDGLPTTERIGERDVVTQRYLFRGRPGHYEVPPLLATWTDEQGASVEGQSTSLFIDVEVEPVQVGELVDIVEPLPVRSLASSPWLIAGGLLSLGLGLATWPRGRSASAEPVRRLPPHREAIEAWERVRDDVSLTDEDKARELSVLFRRYVEAVFGFEATAWTTSELMAHLKSLSLLPEGNLPRARRLLRATDRIKFAEERPSSELIEELDSDLRAFIDATAPSAWQVEPEAPAAPIEAEPVDDSAPVPLHSHLLLAGGLAAVVIGAAELTITLTGVLDGVQPLLRTGVIVIALGDVLARRLWWRP